MTTVIPQPVFTYLLSLTDHRATVEHADMAAPRYSADDMARVLVVTTRQPDSSGEVNGLAGKALQFLNDAQSFNGACRNRMDRAGNWVDQPTTGDHWGRCLLGLGTAAAHSDVSMVRRLATVQFERAAKVRSPDRVAMAYAAVGAAELVAVEPGNSAALRLLTDYAVTVEARAADDESPWPEEHLAYNTAIVAEAMVSAGVALEDTGLHHRGLDSLERILGLEACDHRPIAVAMFADACARATASDPRQIWPDGIRSAVSWFLDLDDAGRARWVPQTGASSEDDSAESSLAVIATLQQAQRLSSVAS